LPFGSGSSQLIAANYSEIVESFEEANFSVLLENDSANRFFGFLTPDVDRTANEDNNGMESDRRIFTLSFVSFVCLLVCLFVYLSQQLTNYSRKSLLDSKYSPEGFFGGFLLEFSVRIVCFIIIILLLLLLASFSSSSILFFDFDCHLVVIVLFRSCLSPPLHIVVSNTLVCANQN
jgi:hypothetical protein